MQQKSSYEGTIDNQVYLITLPYIRWLGREYCDSSKFCKDDFESLYKNAVYYLDKKIIDSFAMLSNDEEKNGYKSEGFIFFFQTKRQVEYIKDNPSKILLIDSTHHTNRYKYKLIIGNYLNKDFRPIPIFYFILEKENENNCRMVFDLLERINESINCEIVMSDLANVYYKSYQSIIKKDAKWLYCAWHFAKALKKNLDTKIKRNSGNIEIYYKVKVYIEELVIIADKDLFEKKLKIYLNTAKINVLNYINTLQNNIQIVVRDGHCGVD